MCSACMCVNACVECVCNGGVEVCGVCVGCVCGCGCGLVGVGKWVCEEGNISCQRFTVCECVGGCVELVISLHQ